MVWQGLKCQNVERGADRASGINAGKPPSCDMVAEKSKRGVAGEGDAGFQARVQTASFALKNVALDVGATLPATRTLGKLTSDSFHGSSRRVQKKGKGGESLPLHCLCSASGEIYDDRSALSTTATGERERAREGGRRRGRGRENSGTPRSDERSGKTGEANRSREQISFIVSRTRESPLPSSFISVSHSAFRATLPSAGGAIHALLKRSTHPSMIMMIEFIK